MIRRRTLFKPNLKGLPAQLAPVQTGQSGSLPSVERDSQAPATSSLADSDPQNNSPAPVNIETSESSVAPTKTNLELSNEKVQEAITQLTGHKFEPIKSLSLRSSANKNVKLKDLLFFNPPMTKDQKRHKKSTSLAKKSEMRRLLKRDDAKQIDSSSKTNSSLETCPDRGESEQELETEVETEPSSYEPSLVPKVKMGPGGKLILDESSTVIDRRNSIRDQTAIVEDNEDVISRTNYDSFRRRPSNTSQTKWSIDDTNKFYQALTILGTDFSMMESLLFAGLRSRTELHKKFKREERVNKLKIDIALSSRISLSSEELDELKEIFYK